MFKVFRFSRVCKCSLPEEPSKLAWSMPHTKSCSPRLILKRAKAIFHLKASGSHELRSERALVPSLLCLRCPLYLLAVQKTAPE
jgi:hypothetical protein